MDNLDNSEFVKQETELKKRIDKARLYTDGDMVKARKMAEGNYKDVSVLKMTFKCNDVNYTGMIAIFINTEKNTLNQFFDVVTKTEDLEGDNTHLPWREFVTTVLRKIYSEKNEINITSKLKHELEKELTPALVGVLSEKIIARDTISINVQFEKMISFVFRSNDVNIKIDFEKTSSLAVDEAIEEIRKEITQSSSKKEETKKEEPVSKPQTIDQKMDRELLEQGNRIIGCKLVLSPVKGKYVSELKEGNKIKVKVKDKSANALKIAEKLGWLKDGKMKPGEVIVRTRIKKSNTNIIYVNIAPNLIGKITEEEEVRVEVLDDVSSPQKGKGGFSKTILVWVLIILVIIGIIGVFIMLQK